MGGRVGAGVVMSLAGAACMGAALLGHRWYVGEAGFAGSMSVGLRSADVCFGRVCERVALDVLMRGHGGAVFRIAGFATFATGLVAIATLVSGVITRQRGMGGLVLKLAVLFAALATGGGVVCLMTFPGMGAVFSVGASFYLMLAGGALGVEAGSP